MTTRIWRLERGDGPLVATAIHDGHELRSNVRGLMSITDADRRREEDPFTAGWVGIAPTRVVGTRSRFEVDLNRPRDTAVYRTPDDAWGLQIWKRPPGDDVVEASLTEYDAFYAALRELYDDLSRRYRRFVVLDLHSYNHRREGPNGPADDPTLNPQVNVGTGTMLDRARWAPIIERFIADVSTFPFPGGTLDVRENVKFRGGNCARWTHANYPDAACVLSVEVKKFFMDEWTGEPFPELIDAVRNALEHAVPGILEELAGLG